MWKATLFLLVLLVGTSIGLMFWQWDAFSKEIADQETIKEAKQQITVAVSGNELSIEQTWTNLEKNKIYTIDIPSVGVDLSCTDDSYDCQAGDEDATSLKADTQGKLTVQLKLPLGDQFNSSLLLTDWLITAIDVPISETDLAISDYSGRAGSWVAGLPLKGMERLNHLHYYSYRGKVGNPSLYWQPTELTYGKSSLGLTFFYEAEAARSLPTLPIAKKLAINEWPYAVVFSDQASETFANGLIIVPRGLDDASLEKLIVSRSINQKLMDPEKWMTAVIVAAITQTKPTHPKALQLYDELVGKLGGEKVGKIGLSLLRKEKFSIQDIDFALTKEFNQSTTFMERNKQENDPFVPLFFNEKRKLTISGEVAPFGMIFYQDKQLFPFVDTMSLLGYQGQVLDDQETIILSKGPDRYRFYLNENIFILNEEDYGLLEKPLTVIGSDIYIDGDWLKTIFNVDITQTENDIKLK